MEEIELIEVELREIQASESSGAQILVLSEVNGQQRLFPIFIGFNEMEALDRALHGKTTARPMTHDLIINAIEGAGAKLVRVLVDDLQDDTFYGKLVIRLAEGTEAYIDSRPSDALVLAARKSVPVFVAEHVLDSIGQAPSDEEFD